MSLPHVCQFENEFVVINFIERFMVSMTMTMTMSWLTQIYTVCCFPCGAYELSLTAVV